ncbi:unnamed protein product [Absidia cylindrospora]
MTSLSWDCIQHHFRSRLHCWSESGVFNIEGGCYAKCIDLSGEKEPDIFNAIKFGAVLENVVLDEETRQVDYSDDFLTENTRCAYPIDFIPNAKLPCVGGHPKNIILLTCDAFGVLPPVSKLTPEQAMYHFISGYITKVAGTEDVNAWLINTGWIGGSASSGAKRCPLKYTRAILDSIHDGSLAKGEFEDFEVFGFSIPKKAAGVPDELLNPRKAWKGTDEDFTKSITQVAGMFQGNFKTYQDQAAPETVAAGPKF